MKTNLYKAAKLVHLTGLVFWLGPSTGGYLLILLAQTQHRSYVEFWLFKEYIKLINIEAVGFSMLLLSGFMMRKAEPALKTARWLRMKLVIVLGVFLPLEAVQLYIYYGIIKKAFSVALDIDNAMLLYGNFSLVSFIFLAVTVPMVFLLAVFRPFSAENRTTAKNRR